MLFSALSLEVWSLCFDLTLLLLISHFSTCLYVLICSSSLLIDFFSLFHLRIALLLLDSVSSESQSYHRTTSLVCFGCVTLCHQICFVLLRVNVCKIRQLLLHYVLHTCTSASHLSFFQVLSWMPMLFAVGLSSWFMRIASCPNACKRCFVTIPSANSSRQGK